MTDYGTKGQALAQASAVAGPPPDKGDGRAVPPPAALLRPSGDPLQDVKGCVYRLAAAHEHYGAGVVTSRLTRQRTAGFHEAWARLAAHVEGLQRTVLSAQSRAAVLGLAALHAAASVSFLCDTLEGDGDSKTERMLEMIGSALSDNLNADAAAVAEERGL